MATRACGSNDVMACRASDLVARVRAAHVEVKAASQSAKLRGEEQPRPWLRFDPLRRPSSPRMASAVGDFVARLEALEAALGTRRRRRDRAAQDSFRCAATTIACNLVWSTVDPLGRPLGVPRDRSLMGAGGRYAHSCYGQGFLDTLDLMARPEVGLIETLSRGFSYQDGASAPSTVRPTAALLALFPAQEVTWRDFARAAEPEVLVLKAPKKKGATSSERIDYPETARTRQLRQQVDRLNTVLLAAPFWFVDDAAPLGLDKTGELIDPLRRTVWRGFNNGTFGEGGRLWGAVWETMRRSDRFRTLRISSALHPEGEPVCNVDFRALNPTLCYVLAGLPIPEADPYDIRGDGSDRPGFKSLLSAMLFAEDRFRQLPSDTRKKFPPGTATKDVVAAIERHHSPIAQRFWTGYGHRLAFVESSILMVALEDLAQQGVTALPLHDSVLVARSEGERARRAMTAAFASATGEPRAALSIDNGEHYQ